MKIFYEDSMPYGCEFFHDLGDCQVFSHQSIDASQLTEADILLVRSTTKVNHELLKQANKLQFVSTATAGTNHMDIPYLKKRGIDYSSAAGCNAVAVAEYVLSAMFACQDSIAKPLLESTVGIVGAGHVGSALAQKLTAMGINHKLCDPPLQDKGDPREFVSLDGIMDCDIISLHTPLVVSGEHPTLHMFDHQRLSSMSENQLLINACRGEVLDNRAALALFEQGKTLNLVLDVWENEPEILLDLVPHIKLATAHIAGHTIEGKARGTEMLYQQVCERLNIAPTKTLEDYLPAPILPDIQLNTDELSARVFQDLVHQVYDVRQDDKLFKQTVAKPGQFAYIRKHYAIRREFAATRVSAGNLVGSEAIYDLGFRRN